MIQADEDLRLLRDCLAGRPGAWEAFVARFAPHLEAVCRGAMGRAGLSTGAQEVADMLQEVFLVFLAQDLRALRSYRGEAPLASYLAVLAVHRVTKEDRGLSAALPVAEEAPGAPGLEAVMDREAGERLQAEIARLPPMLRLALAMQGDGAGVREIGRALGLSKSAAAELLERARALLRERMKEYL